MHKIESSIFLIHNFTKILHKISITQKIMLIWNKNDLSLNQNAVHEVILLKSTG
ncbi:hypothetical protein TTHERM_00149690 (macronuclear) [Tetrahymena thermophila SB210]|uniref:Uncharacterized protein n=1 Tax=Tetrahymena thermophila (strain SB210) TaxID=312017 RepID=I7ML83_TETTS|nr:hypothetical protein TTHERM_00149690 [Tetrahymena thermophila SB210]EAS01358.2 hypothetical protein TTHERM_00149690 [Tetrahymena thermophila SB210]|eukprot:XP_001021604.2 hypothetical protein TTHERM_00149690 [Tetrahymena thermophila SB210]